MTRALAIALACAVGFFTACSDKKTSEPEDEQVVLAEETRIPENDPGYQSATVTPSSVTLLYSSSPPTYETGDIIVGTEDHGYLRRVTSVQTQGNTVSLGTTQAALTDAVYRLLFDTTWQAQPQPSALSAIHVDKQVTRRDGRKFRITAKSDIPIETEQEWGLTWTNLQIVIDEGGGQNLTLQIDTLSLSTELAPRLAVDIDWGLQFFHFSVYHSDHLDLHGISLEWTYSIGSLDSLVEITLLEDVHLVDFMFEVFGWPVIVSLDMDFYAGLDGELMVSSAGFVNANAYISASFTAGAEYSDGGWESIWQRTLNAAGTLTPGSEPILLAELREYLKADLDSRLYFAVGAFGLWAAPYLYEAASYPPRAYELGVGIEGGVDLEMDVVGFSILDYEWPLLDYRVAIWGDTSGGGQIVYIGLYNTLGEAYGVHVSGSYAYMADGFTGLEIIDISNPSSPTLAGLYNTPVEAYGVHVSGSYAYVADSYGGLLIFNVSNPSSPTLVGSYNTPGNAEDVLVSGLCAYVADHVAGLQVINVSNPSFPTLAWSYDTPGEAQGVHVVGSYAYVADGSSGLQIFNISIPSFVGSYNTPGTAFGVYVSGSHAYVADLSSGLQIINVSNPSSPTLAGSYNTPGEAWGVRVSGSYAYVADRDAGLQVIDVSSPSSPTLAASYNTPGRAYRVHVSGSYAYVADWYSGLQILQFVP